MITVSLVCLCIAGCLALIGNSIGQAILYFTVAMIDYVAYYGI